MSRIKQVALDGQFAISESGGKALQQALREMREWVDEKRADLAELGDMPPLGSSQGADAMKQFVPQVATDSQGFLTQLMSFRSSIEQAEQGIEIAMKNYREMDQRGASRNR